MTYPSPPQMPARPVAMPAVAVSGLVHTYGRGHAEVHALDIDALAVFPGEVLLVEGPSGSGKTTLISVLGTLLRPTRGGIEIGGRAVDFGDQRALDRIRRSEIGFVFQSFSLLAPLTATENVTAALNAAGTRGRAAHRRATELLDSLGVAHRAHARPRDLSGGEQQRVAIARALANEPRLVIADEPTANLDTDHSLELGHVLASLAGRGHAVVLATHDPRLEPFATRRIRLLDGRIAAE
ncbi:MAG: ABC transporter ATP-binding protein [Acidimicrobiia bacterium]|nr:ABC transporter ATP-binding protein [Acidimicrobiia bacterium]